MKHLKTQMSKDEILSTGDWYEGDYINMMEGYFWKHKNIQEDGYVFYTLLGVWFYLKFERGQINLKN